jgi:hypothetical protein
MVFSVIMLYILKNTKDTEQQLTSESDEAISSKGESKLDECTVAADDNSNGCRN